ncbi:ATP-binding protein [Pelovirga terrestris]|uniref:histidine kinase n=1 Tax=Pelovirga terrestris TaxID=2771352 RepID=A0A8J6QZF9_9BACT|nr:ATP-binding protein [Pelovirga terrestris]MBD1401292.1 PAS domain S-box protein [Pelovirga terrestris]
MTERAKQLRTYFIVALLLFVTGTVALTTYSLWRARNDAILNGIGMSSMYSRSFEDFITQSLHVTELVGANIVGLEGQFSDPDAAATNLFRVLRHTPFLRSISMIDDRASIIASSNVANIGIDVALDHYLPPATEKLEMLRIGIPWSGRDFADGQPNAGGDQFSRFIPLVRTLIEGGQASTLLINLNPDYFINHMAQQIAMEEGTVEIVRYDGILLMSTDPDEQPGALREYVTRELQLSEEEFGEFKRELEDGRHVLTAFRASRLYPFVVVTNINRDYVLRHWTTQAQTLLGVVVPALLAVILLTIVFYRRQLHFLARQAEYERLQRINATVFDASTEATLITDVEAKIISLNPAFTRVTGYRPEDAIGHLLTEFMTADDTQTFFQSVNSEPIEVQHRCKDGSLIWAEILSTPERNDQGDVTGFYRISRNITDRKQAQLALEQKNQEMEHFVYIVSHDLKSPLITVQSFVNMLRQDLQEGNQQDIYDDLGYIEKATDKMQQLLGALLQFSRIGTADTPAQTLTAEQSVQGCLDSLAGILHQHLIQVSTGKLPQPLYGDPMHFGQIWQNLIENAVKYRGNQVHPQIEIGATQEGQDVVFYVRDNGMGIGPEDGERIFNLFSQLNPASDGSGLGLALVKKIVTIYQGRIWVESAGKDKGSCFKFTLPGAIKGYSEKP